MSVKLTILDDKALTNALRKYGAKSEKAISEAVRVTAVEVQADSVKSIQRGSKTGRTYKRGNITHRASAPGEAPATDSEILVGSIDTVKLTRLSYKTGTLLDYGRWLEYGTQKIAERPWLRPAVQRNKEEFFRRLRIAISS
jgi:hypothetical protein